MSIAWEHKRTDETRSIEQLLRQHFPGSPAEFPPTAYRYNSASIRVRLVNPAFQGKSRIEREDLVYPLLRTLPENTQDDIMILLLLTPEEVSNTLMSFEFDHPQPSRLDALPPVGAAT